MDPNEFPLPILRHNDDGTHTLIPAEQPEEEFSDELPTLSDVTRALGGNVEAAIKSDGGWVHTEVDKDQRLRCAICDGPSGLVTLQYVQSKDGKHSGYVCIDGDCAGQQAKAVQRMLNRAAKAGQEARKALRAEKEYKSRKEQKANKRRRKQAQKSKRANWE